MVFGIWTFRHFIYGLQVLSMPLSSNKDLLAQLGEVAHICNQHVESGDRRMAVSPGSDWMSE